MTSFTSELWTQVRQRLGINAGFSAQYHYQSHGLIERTNRSIEDVHQKYLNIYIYTALQVSSFLTPSAASAPLATFSAPLAAFSVPLTYSPPTLKISSENHLLHHQKSRTRITLFCITVSSSSLLNIHIITSLWWRHIGSLRQQNVSIICQQVCSLKSGYISLSITCLY